MAPSSKVLDAGCGIGYGSQLLADHAASVCAVDVDVATLDYARRYWNHPVISHETQDLHFLQFADATVFDAIVAFEVVEHLIEPRLFLRRARQVLSEQGRLFLSVPNEKVIPHTVELNPFHIRHYTPGEIASLLEECGYAVQAICSQTANEIVVGDAGKFLILEAAPVGSPTGGDVLRNLEVKALAAGVVAINQRAVALSKAKKDVNGLKSRLEEAKRGGVNQQQIPGANGTFDAVMARMTQLEAGIMADLRHRVNVLETTERGARDALAEARFEAVRLEAEIRNLRSELKYANDIAQHRVNVLETSERGARDALAEARFEAVRLEAEIRNLRSELKHANDIAQSATSRLEVELAEVARLTGRDRLQSEEITTLRKASDAQREELLILADRVAERDAQLETLTELKAQLDDAQRCVAAFTNERAGLQEELAALSQTAASLEARLAEQEAKLQEQQAPPNSKPLSQKDENLLRDAKKNIEKLNQTSLRLVAFSKENEILVKANEQLAGELEHARHQTVHARSGEHQRKEPPSVGYVWRKLKYHRFYGPFLLKAVRNSFGLKRTKKTQTRART
jgi:SAM-dependent methyltransferase